MVKKAILSPQAEETWTISTRFTSISRHRQDLASSEGYDKSPKSRAMILHLTTFWPLLSSDLWMNAGTAQAQQHITVHKVDGCIEVNDRLLGVHDIYRVR